MKKAYYFGRWKQDGHYLWSNDGHYFSRTEIPWTLAELDGSLQPRPEIVGHARLHHRMGWTALAIWDRSGDSRPGSTSVFMFEGKLNYQETLQAIQQAFPDLWKRMNTVIVLDHGGALLSPSPAPP
jgi:hypothetical protein